MFYAEPKSLLDRIGDALKGEAEQKKETVSKDKIKDPKLIHPGQELRIP